MSKDAIYRQDAIDALNKEIIKRRLLDDVNDGMLDEFDTEDILRKLPSAQPDIIRCGECRHLHDNDCPVVGWGRDDDDYCAWAERDNDE